MTLFEISLEMTSEIVILLIALYGAILSTLVFVFNVKTRVKVTISYGISTGGQFQDQWYYHIQAVNRGNTTTTLKTPYIFLPKSRQFPKGLKVPLVNAYTDVDKFPYVLYPGRSCTVWTGAKKLARTLTYKDERTYIGPDRPASNDTIYKGKIKIRGVYEDTTGKTYKSKKVPFDIDEELKDL